SSVPAVATLHDASLFSMPPTDPQVSEREQRPFRVAASKAVRIITDSAFSRAELAMHLKIDPADIDVVHLGVSQVFAEREPAVQSSHRTPYLLFVGALEARKGFFTLLDALKLLPTFGASAVDVVLAGQGTEVQVFPPVGESRIRSVGWVDDQALARLYREALALVYPSEYEGYGLPIVEAMAAGTPAVAADTPSSREAGGSAALYFPPGDALMLAKVIASLAVAPDDVRADIRRRGEEHARSRTWDETAQQTLSVFERALGPAGVDSLRDS
ncbi:MAG TPA: glycosyltransferase family 1 protein, partial [Candidatus Acidoferrales bacterium]|nr:glycosyltransferase family 1 protein [Candidatus Acidoferrales bacterium]